MRNLIRYASVVLAALTLTAMLGRAEAGSLALRSGSTLWLEGKSNLHEFQSKTSTLQVTFDENAAAWPASAKGGEAVERFIRDRGVTSIQVVVPVTGLHSGKAGLDKNMYKTMNAARYPDIHFELSSYEIAGGAGVAEIAIDAKGKLSIAGVEHEIHLPVTAIREGEVLRLKGSTPLLMTDYGIKPPTLMMGALRTANQVVVHFDLAVGTKDAGAVGPSGSE